MKQGEGKEKLLGAMARVTDSAFETISVTEPIDSDIIQRASKDGDIRSIEYSETEITVTLRLRKDITAKYRK